MKEDQCVTVQDIEEVFDVSYGSTQDILVNKFGMWHVSAQWVPQILSSGQMGNRVKQCQQYPNYYAEERDRFLNRIVTRDETWEHMFEPKTKCQSSVWKHPSSPSPYKSHSDEICSQSYMIEFCAIQGISLTHMVPWKTTISGEYNATLLRTELYQAIKRQHPYLIQSGIT